MQEGVVMTRHYGEFRKVTARKDSVVDFVDFLDMIARGMWRIAHATKGSMFTIHIKKILLYTMDTDAGKMLIAMYNKTQHFGLYGSTFNDVMSKVAKYGAERHETNKYIEYLIQRGSLLWEKVHSMSEEDFRNYFIELVTSSY